jgi:sirohydrochlorin ferrochelatase
VGHSAGLVYFASCPVDSMDIYWLGFTALMSSLLGNLALQYMTVHPIKLGRTGFQTGGAVILFLGSLAQSPENFVLNISVTIAGFSVGYLFATWRFLEMDDTRYVPELTREEGDKGDGHTAIVYFTHGEPETYSPIGWINQFKEFDEQGIKFIPFPFRPLFIRALRKSYLRVGKSNHRGTHIEMLRSLERQFRDAGDESTQFYISFLDDEPRPDASVIQALNDGASRIVVSEVFLTISNHTAEGEELISELGVTEKFGVPVVYTGPLWDSDTLKSMFVERANANRDEFSKEETGILLVGHGQPDEWDVEWATETEQETSFRQDVLKLFANDGYMIENLSLAWMEFKTPKPAKKVEEFVKNGVKQVLFFSAAISADAIHSQHDVPELVHEAKIPDGIVTKNLGAWNNDPIVIRAIKEKIDRVI